MALDRVISVDTIIDGKTNAVASTRDNGIQIVDMADPYVPIPVSVFVNGTAGSAYLDSARAITSTINDTPYHNPSCIKWRLCNYKHG